MDPQSTSPILVSVAAGEAGGRARARWGKTSAKGLPALDSPVRAVMARPGWLATRRTASAPVYPDAPRMARRAGEEEEGGACALGRRGLRRTGAG